MAIVNGICKNPHCGESTPFISKQGYCPACRYAMRLGITTGSVIAFLIGAFGMLFWKLFLALLGLALLNF